MKHSKISNAFAHVTFLSYFYEKKYMKVRYFFEKDETLKDGIFWVRKYVNSIPNKGDIIELHEDFLESEPDAQPYKNLFKSGEYKVIGITDFTDNVHATWSYTIHILAV